MSQAAGQVFWKSFVGSKLTVSLIGDFRGASAAARAQR
jgi:hypothetical protein